LTQQRGQWSTQFAFILAATGSAVGLGNIWRFPYVAGTNGGGAFVLIYLACIFAIGLPIFISELYLGQKSQTNAVKAFEVLDKKGTFWQLPGWMGLLAAILIMSFYSVIGGWILDFEFRTIIGEFRGASEEQIRGTLGSLFKDPVRQTIWHFIFTAGSIGIVLGGVKNGLERWNKVLMPMLLAILAGLVIKSMFMPGFKDAISFMFSFDASKLSKNGVLEAVGQAFFTLSLGMGAILTYGSYLSKKESLPRIALTVAFMDTLVAILSGLIIFSVVFTFGMEASEGPGLILETLPTLFSKMPGGYFIGIAFFLLVSFAAFTSSVSVLEVMVAYFVDKNKHSRTKITLICGTSTFLLGILTVFSFNILADFKLPLLGVTFFGFFEQLSANWLLPIGGMLICLFFGWRLGQPAAEAVFPGEGATAKVLRFGLIWTSRVLAPIAVLLVILNTVIGL
jgi:NSS family neurotransmitter:Na+ symporter